MGLEMYLDHSINVINSLFWFFLVEICINVLTN